jgi:uncharacterized OB-fold protein
MTKFEDELKKNNFVCSECVKCQHLVWPPSEFCNKCLGEVMWRPLSKSAQLVEFSTRDGIKFGIAEFEGNIRVFGTIEGNSPLRIGEDLVLTHCSYDESPKFTFKTLSFE